MSTPSASRARGALANLGLFVLAMAVGALVAEGALRLSDPLQRVPDNPPLSERLRQSARHEVREVAQGNLFGVVEPSGDPDTVYRLKPGRAWLFEGAPVRTNALGFRGSEWPATRSADTLRVVGVGDSVSFGWGVAEPETFLARLADALAARPELGPVEVRNAAVPGYNAEQEAALVETRLMAFAPDVLLVGYVRNDHEPAVFQSPRGLAAVGERSYLVELLRRALEPRLLAPRRVAGAFARLARAARAGGASVVVFLYPQEVPGADPELPRRLCARHGFAFVDLAAPFEEHCRARGLRGLSDLALSPRDPHPNAEAHALIARVLEPVVSEALRAARARRPARPRATPASPGSAPPPAAPSVAGS